ncbi:MAG: hypothetical protein WDZ49_02210 [Litorilinea sp.]
MANRSPELNGPPHARLGHAQLGVDPQKQSALFRLRARLTWRQFMREPGQIAGMLGFLAFFLPVALGLGIGTGAGYLMLPDPWPGEILGAVLTLIWAVWMLAPLVSYRLNEGLDMARLMVYPLRRRDILVASVAGTIFDLPSYLTLPVVLAIFVGWFALPVLPIILLAVAIWYAQLMLSSQMVLHASGGLLRSRRFRDLSIVIFSLFGMSCYFVSQFVQYLLRDISRESFENFSALVWLQWTPPGAAARAIERAAANDWLASLLWLGLAALWLAPLGWGWWHVTTRILTGASIFGNFAATAPKPAPKAVPVPNKTTPLTPARNLWAWLPFPVRQLAWKELVQTWRVPQRRIGMLQGLFMPLLFAVIWGVNPWGETSVIPSTPWLFLILPGYTIMALWAASQNTLGWEGPGLQMLLLTPIRRRTLLAGKALGILIQIIGINALLALALGLVIQSWWVIPGWIIAFGTTLAGFAVTLAASVRFAHPVKLESTSRNTGNTGGGCITGLVNGLLMPMGIMAINAPIAGLFALIYWQDLQWLIVPGALLSLGYGSVIFFLGLNFAERLLLAHEPELIAATSKPGES